MVIFTPYSNCIKENQQIKKRNIRANQKDLVQEEINQEIMVKSKLQDKY